MKRLHFFWILLILLLSVPLYSLAQSGLTETVSIDVWLRTGPGTQWRKLEILPAGTTVALDGRDSSGLWVRGISSGGKVGWMAARFLTVTSAGVFSLAVIDREAPLAVAAPAQGAGPGVAAAANNAPAQASVSVAAPVSGGVAATATANVNMRSGPGTGFRRVGGLSRGGTLNIDGRDATLRWVRGINGQGVVGWVSASFLSLGFDQVAALPIVDVNTPFALGAPGSAPQASSAPASSNPAPVTSTAPVTGFSYGGHVDGFSDFAANWMRTAGMTWVKRQVRYSAGQDPSSVAGLINDAHARGFRILLGIVGHNNEVNNGGYFDQYAAFVGGVAGLGADAIEIWNEMNIDREWPAGSIDPARYTQLLAASYNAIKSVNSNTLVISGAPAPTGFFGGCSPFGCDDAFYISGMAAAGAASYMDCLGIHYNEGIVSPNQTSGDPRSEHFTRYFWGMVNTYSAAIGGRRPLCFTELGYLSPEGYGALPPNFAWAGGTTVAQHALWLDQAVSLSRNSGKVRLLIVWNVDFTGFGDDPMGGYAIIRPDGSCPACNALSN